MPSVATMPGEHVPAQTACTAIVPSCGHADDEIRGYDEAAALVEFPVSIHIYTPSPAVAAALPPQAQSEALRPAPPMMAWRCALRPNVPVRKVLDLIMWSFTCYAKVVPHMRYCECSFNAGTRVMMIHLVAKSSLDLAQFLRGSARIREIAEDHDADPNGPWNIISEREGGNIWAGLHAALPVEFRRQPTLLAQGDDEDPWARRWIARHWGHVMMGHANDAALADDDVLYCAGAGSTTDLTGALESDSDRPRAISDDSSIADEADSTDGGHQQPDADPLDADTSAILANQLCLIADASSPSSCAASTPNTTTGDDADTALTLERLSTIALPPSPAAARYDDVNVPPPHVLRRMGVTDYAAWCRMVDEASRLPLADPVAAMASMARADVATNAENCAHDSMSVESLASSHRVPSGTDTAAGSYWRAPSHFHQRPSANIDARVSSAVATATTADERGLLPRDHAAAIGMLVQRMQACLFAMEKEPDEDVDSFPMGIHVQINPLVAIDATAVQFMGHEAFCPRALSVQLPLSYLPVFGGGGGGSRDGGGSRLAITMGSLTQASPPLSSADTEHGAVVELPSSDDDAPSVTVVGYTDKRRSVAVKVNLEGVSLRTFRCSRGDVAIPPQPGDLVMVETAEGAIRAGACESVGVWCCRRRVRGSGGSGRVLRLATAADTQRLAGVVQPRAAVALEAARRLVRERGLPQEIVSASLFFDCTTLVATVRTLRRLSSDERTALHRQSDEIGAAVADDLRRHNDDGEVPPLAVVWTRQP